MRRWSRDDRVLSWLVIGRDSNATVGRAESVWKWNDPIDAVNQPGCVNALYLPAVFEKR